MKDRGNGRGIAMAAARRTAWVVVALVGVALARGPHDVALARTTTVALSGSVRGLVPGVASPIRVSVRNGARTAAHVTHVEATVRADRARCDRYLSVAPYDGAVDVPPNAVRHVVLRALVATRLPEQCRTVSWTLDYAAR
jgi:hypothetical protein